MSRLEKAANLAVIVVCLLIVGNLGWNAYLRYKGAANRQPGLVRGQVVKLPGADPASPRPTLALVLSKDCHFCQTSVEFYRKLSAFQQSASQELRLVAALPDSANEAAAYLKEQGIAVDAVLSLPVSELGVEGTPTLLLLDEQQKLLESWVGRLDSAQESQVLSRLQQVCARRPLPATS